MAPEVYNNEPCNQTLDYYSVGLVLYWLLNERRLPFLPLPPVLPTASKNEEAIARRMNGEKAPEPKFGCDRLKKVIAKAIEFDPAKRYKTATEMKYDLIDVLQKEELDTIVLGLNGAVIGKTQTESILEKTVAEPLETETVFEATVNETLTVFESTEKNADTETELKTTEEKVDTPSYESVESDAEITETLSVFGTAEKKTDSIEEETDIEKTASVFDDKKDNTIKAEDKPKKKNKIGLLIGLAAVIAVVVFGIVFFGGDKEITSNNLVYWGVDSSNVLRLSTKALTSSETAKASGSFYESEGMSEPRSEWKEVVAVEVKNLVSPVGRFSFENLGKCKTMDIKNLDTSRITNMNKMFYSCGNIEHLDLKNFDTSNVNDMSYMFSCCYNLTSLNLKNFDTSNVSNMSYMFFDAYHLKNLDLSGFDMRNVKESNYMFWGTVLTASSTGLSV